MKRFLCPKCGGHRWGTFNPENNMATAKGHCNGEINLSTGKVIELYNMPKEARKTMVAKILNQEIRVGYCDFTWARKDDAQVMVGEDQ